MSSILLSIIFTDKMSLTDSFQPERFSEQQLLEKLKESTEGILWSSESDYPLEVVFWETSTISPEKLLQLTNKPPDTVVTVQEGDKFFAKLFRQYKQYISESSDEESEKEYKSCLVKCQKLADLLKANLTDIQYFDVGGNQSEIHLYLIGKSPSGNILGLSTIGIYT
ncbi:nuclease [Brasilonema bromeliae SPC951]|uniref:Nuclease n=2 Tax=Bromeliae group (in: Brasilonema) TaxID=3398495 RepID=A0ABX1P9F9_9CYAN|nr:nuclease [Brasilonema bromeliae SPC951]